MDNELHCLRNSRRIRVGIIGHHLGSGVDNMIQALNEVGMRLEEASTMFRDNIRALDVKPFHAETKLRRRGQRNFHGRSWE